MNTKDLLELLGRDDISDRLKLVELRKRIEANKPRPIETAIVGDQIIACEPFYGWLIVAKQADGSFQQKTTGNYWLPVPKEVEFTKWLPYPGGARND